MSILQATDDVLFLKSGVIWQVNHLLEGNHAIEVVDD